jgi:hypothetical protein
MLSETLMGDKFKDVVIDAMHAKIKETKSEEIRPMVKEVAKIVYPGTLQGSPARKFITQDFTSHCSSADTGDCDSLPKDFMFDVMRALLAKCNPSPVSDVDMGKCKYHNHGIGGNCYLHD